MDEETSASKGPSVQKCEVCRTHFADVCTYADHLESREHARGVAKKKYGRKYLEAKAKLMKLEVTPHESDDDDESEDPVEVYTCELCERVCTGAVNFQIHLLGKKHQKNLRKAEVFKQMQKENWVPEETGTAVEHGTSLRSHFTSDEFPSLEMLKCSSPAARQQHIRDESLGTLRPKTPTNPPANRDESHAKLLALRKKISSLGAGESDIDDAIVCRCHVCGKAFTGPLQYRQHMQSGSHSRHVRQAEHLERFRDLYISGGGGDGIRCRECSKSFNGPEPFGDHLKSPSHARQKQRGDLLNRLRSKHPEMAVMSDTTMIVCRVCHVAFTGPETARDHFQSRKHGKVVSDKKCLERLMLAKERGKPSGAKQDRANETDSSEEYMTG